MKILIIRLSSLGDIILTQPVAASLRQAFPDAQIDFITKPVFKPIVEKFDCLDNIIDWNESFASLRNIRKSKYDICIDLHAKFNTFLIKTFCHAKKTSTYNKKHKLRKTIVQHKTNAKISSTVDLYFSALKKLNIPFTYSPPQLHLKNPTEKKSNNTTIGIFPGATYKTKQYPPQKLIELIQLFPQNWNVTLFGSPSEISLSSEIAANCKRKITDLTGKLNLEQLLYKISELDVVITNDSGPMHIAAALNKPQIAIFGATDPVLGFSPMNSKAIIINQTLPCKPCSLHGSSSCPKGHFNCMLSHDNHKIYEKIKTFIS